MDDSSSNIVSCSQCSESSSTNTINNYEYGACIFHHDDDYALASEIAEYISNEIDCKPYQEIRTSANKTFPHVKEISSKCKYIVLLITNIFQNDNYTQHLRDEFIINNTDNIVVIKGENLKTYFGLNSYRTIDWQNKEKAKKLIKVFFNNSKMASDRPPQNNTVNIKHLIVQIGDKNTVHVDGTSEKPVVMSGIKSNEIFENLKAVSRDNLS